MENKIIPFFQVHEIASRLRDEGKKIVHAHGVFDILHIGHKRHLELAKTMGDILFISVTSDRFVDKGPDRPIFTSELRSELLAEFSCVDYVFVNDNASAVPAINALKPNIYFKGDEYAEMSSDVTGKIKSEKLAVEQNGGKIEFSSEITFSSSNLINKTMDLYPDGVSIFLGEASKQISEKDFIEAFGLTSKIKILVVGEVIVDQYTYVEALGKPSKENILSTRHLNDVFYWGGVLPVANNLSNFCSKVDLLTLVGSEDKENGVSKKHLRNDVGFYPFCRKNGITVRKRRFVDPSYLRKLFEINYVDKHQMSEEDDEQISSWLEKNIGNYDAVVCNDFGHGLISEKSRNILSEKSKFLCLNAQTNSANRGFNYVTKYKRADFICIDAPEARLAFQDEFQDIEDLAYSIQNVMGAEGVVITNGKKGAVAIDNKKNIFSLPAFSTRAVDTMGAGDSFFSVASCIFLVSRNAFMAAFAGNAIASMQIKAVGQAEAVSRISLLKYIRTLLA